jgi:hypothetical protein
MAMADGDGDGKGAQVSMELFGYYVQFGQADESDLLTP